MKINQFLRNYEQGIRQFQGINLQSATLSESVLVAVDLQYAKLIGADFSRCFF